MECLMLCGTHLMDLYIYVWTDKVLKMKIWSEVSYKKKKKVDENLKWSLLKERKEFAVTLLSTCYLKKPFKMNARRSRVVKT